MSVGVTDAGQDLASEQKTYRFRVTQEIGIQGGGALPSLTLAVMTHHFSGWHPEDAKIHSRYVSVHHCSFDRVVGTNHGIK